MKKNQITQQFPSSRHNPPPPQSFLHSPRIYKTNGIKKARKILRQPIKKRQTKKLRRTFIVSGRRNKRQTTQRDARARRKFASSPLRVIMRPYRSAIGREFPINSSSLARVQSRCLFFAIVRRARARHRDNRRAKETRTTRAEYICTSRIKVSWRRFRGDYKRIYTVSMAVYSFMAGELFRRLGRRV